MPTGTRRIARESALQAIYLMDLCKQGVEEILKPTWSAEMLDSKTQEFADHLIQGTAAHRDELDGVIMKYTQNWAMERMAGIDRCLMRLAAFELLYDLDTPVSVIINEALEIAKKYSTAESSKFVNGILDKVKLERKTEKE
jgi:transcription antitermination protein NusB